ncbi:MAG: hypothetical protein Q4G02_04205 [bacterium]|nr:hypothetical protein [bacterium]
MRARFLFTVLITPAIFLIWGIVARFKAGEDKHKKQAANNKFIYAAALFFSIGILWLVFAVIMTTSLGDI